MFFLSGQMNWDYANQTRANSLFKLLRSMAIKSGQTPQLKKDGHSNSNPELNEEGQGHLL